MNIRVAIVRLACMVMLAAANATVAQTLAMTVANPYREIVDRGNTTLTLSALYAMPAQVIVDCAVPMVLSRTGNAFVLEMRGKAGIESQPPCYNQQVADVGTLSAGRYTVTARLTDANGVQVARLESAFDVVTVAGRCDALPQLHPKILAAHRTLSPSQLRERVLNDAAFAASLGYPVVEVVPTFAPDRPGDIAFLDYPPLLNATEVHALLDATGQFLSVSPNGYACGLPPPDALETFVEFHHTQRDHYFYTGNHTEIAALDTGAIAGWTRTGATFRAVEAPGCVPFQPYAANALGVVYRFYGLPGTGPDSHFFTRDRDECYAVDKSAQWLLEGIPFWAWRVQGNGACPDPATQTALYRAWRPFGESSHRFSTDRAVIDAMVRQGWIDEGPAMCVLKPAS
jgi:hypothetical protein